MAMSFGHGATHRGEFHLHGTMGDYRLARLNAGRDLDALTIVATYGHLTLDKHSGFVGLRNIHEVKTLLLGDCRRRQGYALLSVVHQQIDIGIGTREDIAHIIHRHNDGSECRTVGKTAGIRLHPSVEGGKSIEGVVARNAEIGTADG